MKVNGAKIGIFLGGFALGAVVSYFVTDKMVDKVYRDAADEEITKASQQCNEKIKGYKAQIKELQEKISRQKVTINTLADQVRENKKGEVDDILKELDEDDEEADPRPDISGGKGRTKESEKEERAAYTEYRRLSHRNIQAKRPADEDQDGVEFDPVEEEELIEQRGPRVIDEDTFSNTAIGYSKEELSFYMYDGKLISEDGELIEDYAGIIGEEWQQYGRRGGDEVYVRNDNLGADYMISFIAGFGEEHISLDSTDNWED